VVEWELPPSLYGIDARHLFSLKCWPSITLPFVELAGDETIMPLNINNELRVSKWML